ncbi:MAG: DDE-type integrase/transposase/recombinase [Desulfovibrio sp.]|nr:DDE-type integrase/transposase/recombinase [Desulfovibrio sp.]
MADAYTSQELAGFLSVVVSSVLRRAKREDWQARKRQGRGGGNEWLLASMPTDTRDAIAAAMIASDPQDTLAHAPAIPDTFSKFSQKQRDTALARLLFVREIERVSQAVQKEKAIRQLVEASTKGKLSPSLAKAVAVANDRYGNGEHRGLSRRRLYEWCSLFAEGGEAALVPRHQGKDMTVPAWAPAFLAIFQQPQKPTIADAYRRFADEYKGKQPSIFAVRRWLDKVALPDREVGRATGNALLKLRPHKRRKTDELWPGDVYTADGTTFDGEIQHPLHGQPFKPEITLVIDVATRRCVGLSLGLAESAFTVLDALRMACLFGGIPAILYTDNGSGYKNALMRSESTGMLARLGIEMRNSIPGRPQGKGLMERAVKTICGPVAKRLPSSMHADMDVDAGKKVYKITRAEINKLGKSNLLPTWEAFKTAMLARVEEYNATPHRGLPKIENSSTGRRRHLSPDEAWRNYELRNWEPVRVAESIKDELFMPGIPRKVRNGMVQLFNGSYYSEDLADFHGDYVEVRYDIWDSSRVYAWTTRGEKICTAVLDGNSIPYFPQNQVEAARDRRAKAQISRLADKVARIAPGASVQLPEAPQYDTLVADTLSAPKPVVLDLPVIKPAEAAAPARRPLFTSVQERYAWLMRNRDRWTGADDDWAAEYVRSPHYADLHDYYRYEGIAWDGSTVQAQAK